MLSSTREASSFNSPTPEPISTMTRRNALTGGYPSKSPARLDGQRSHFLESCFLCNKQLAKNGDIFMYKGDVPFCSEACRQEQMESDVGKEKKRSLSSIKAMRKKEQMESASTATAQEYSLRPGTVVAA